MNNMYRNDNNQYFDFYNMDNNMNYYNPYYRKDDVYLNSNYIRDYGLEPFVMNLEEITKKNDSFRTALWTGKHLQLTIMNIGVGEDIGTELHPDIDQFIYIEQGRGIAKMGDRKENLDFQRNIFEGYAIIIPAGKWHNIINVGNIPLKLYSIYAPPKHPKGTVEKSKKY